MNHRILAISLLVLTMSVSHLRAQQRTTIQLPTFQNFSMSTTVRVPDRGRTDVGRIGRSHSTTSRRGVPLLPDDRLTSAGSTASGVSVSAWVHDLNEMDRRIMEQWRSSPGRAALQRQRGSNETKSPSVDHALRRVGDLRREQTARRNQQHAIAQRQFATAERLRAKGKLSAARAVYKSAYKRADEQLRASIRSARTQMELLAQEPTTTPKQR